MGGGSGKFTFHIIQTAQYNIKPIEGFAIAADRQLIPSSENIIFVDRFSTEETSFYKSYDKQVLLDAMHSASLIADKMPLLGVLSYSLYILYTNSWLSVNDTVIFEKYGDQYDARIFDGSHALVGFKLYDADVYSTLESIIKEYDECTFYVDIAYD